MVDQLRRALLGEGHLTGYCDDLQQDAEILETLQISANVRDLCGTPWIPANPRECRQSPQIFADLRRPPRMSWSAARRPTAAHSGRQRPIAAHSGQQRPTAAHSGPQRGLGPQSLGLGPLTLARGTNLQGRHVFVNDISQDLATIFNRMQKCWGACPSMLPKITGRSWQIAALSPSVLLLFLNGFRLSGRGVGEGMDFS